MDTNPVDNIDLTRRGLFVYRIVNTVTNKFYVGKTKVSLAARLRRHFGCLNYPVTDRSTLLQRSMVKHGKGAFRIELLQECSTEEELNAAEQDWIRRLDATNLTIGYNMTHGGDGGKLTEVSKQKIRDKLAAKRETGWRPWPAGKHLSDETKKKISEALSGEKNHMYGRALTFSDETRRKLSESHKGEKNHFFGKKHSEESLKKMRKPRSQETCKRISDSHKGKKLSQESIEHRTATVMVQTQKRDAQIIDLFNQGYTRKEIAEKLDLTYTIVKYAIARHNKSRSLVDRRTGDAIP